MKTKLGISVGLFGAAVYLTLHLGGYTPFFILAAYVLFKEDNEWLRKVVLKAFVFSLICDFATRIVGLVPDAISLMDDLTGIFGKSFRIPVVSNIVSFLRSGIYIIETVVFLLLGFQALKMNDFPIAFVDNIVNDALGTVTNAADKVKEKVNAAPAASENNENNNQQ
jgi:hypothetical protein